MQPAQLWDAALGELQLQMTKANFDTWLKDTFLVAQEDSHIVIGVGSPFAVETLEQRLSPMIRKVLSGIVGHEVGIEFVVQQKKPRGRGKVATEVPLEGASRSRNGRSRGESAAPSYTAEASLNPRYIFDSFVVGKGNQLAHAACQAVADDPGRAYNPLFLYGGVGLGKTHLMQAIGHEILRRGMRVLYVSSETFTNEMIDSIREHRTEDFRNKYRRVQLLLVDDIQFIAGKVGTQEEFFHTFNAIHEGGGQIVISCDRPPKAISTLEDRLRSRFEWGLIADIQPPDLETRIAILRSKCQSQGINVPEEVLEAIARKVQSNIRELEGSLNRIVAQATVNGEPITVQTASAALNEVMFNISRRFIKPETIMAAVARYYHVSEEDLRGKARDKRVVLPRQVSMYLLREETELPLVEVGRLFGGRDHTTVLHSVEKVGSEVTNGGPVAKDLAALRESIYSSSNN
ncbi:MAG TPA: chromosomal replication initiator protein DnaA [Chloroflexota bacterium]|nr:chromosomal replication initiator protein DnaA [Chloroflexota bacterium]